MKAIELAVARFMTDGAGVWAIAICPVASLLGVEERAEPLMTTTNWGVLLLGFLASRRAPGTSPVVTTTAFAAALTSGPEVVKCRL